MKNQISQRVYAKYESSADARVIITLHSGRIVRGRITGFFLNDSDSKCPVIKRWHIVREGDEYSSGYDPLGVPAGIFINPKEIERIQFLDDNSVFSD